MFKKSEMVTTRIKKKYKPGETNNLPKRTQKETTNYIRITNTQIYSRKELNMDSTTLKFQQALKSSELFYFVHRRQTVSHWNEFFSLKHIRAIRSPSCSEWSCDFMQTLHDKQTLSSSTLKTTVFTFFKRILKNTIPEPWEQYQFELLLKPVIYHDPSHLSGSNIHQCLQRIQCMDPRLVQTNICENESQLETKLVRGDVTTRVPDEVVITFVYRGTWWDMLLYINNVLYHYCFIYMCFDFDTHTTIGRLRSDSEMSIIVKQCSHRTSTSNPMCHTDFALQYLYLLDMCAYKKSDYTRLDSSPWTHHAETMNLFSIQTRTGTNSSPNIPRNVTLAQKQRTIPLYLYHYIITNVNTAYERLDPTHFMLMNILFTEYLQAFRRIYRNFCANGFFHKFCGVRSDVVPFLMTLWSDLNKKQKWHWDDRLSRILEWQYHLQRICSKFNRFSYRPLCVPNLIYEALYIHKSEFFIQTMIPLLKHPLESCIVNEIKTTQGLMMVQRWRLNVKRSSGIHRNLKLFQKLRSYIHTNTTTAITNRASNIATTNYTDNTTRYPTSPSTDLKQTPWMINWTNSFYQQYNDINKSILVINI